MTPQDAQAIARFDERNRAAMSLDLTRRLDAYLDAMFVQNDCEKARTIEDSLKFELCVVYDLTFDGALNVYLAEICAEFQDLPVRDAVIRYLGHSRPTN